MGVKGTRFATIVTETEPDMNKKGNPFYDDNKLDLRKTTTMNVTLGFNYTNSVNNQQLREGKEGDFKAHERKWGERIPGTTLVEHGDKMYLEVKCNAKPQEVTYKRPSSGLMIDPEDVKPFLRKKADNKEHQGVEQEIIMRDIKLDNIREIKINGEHYEIVKK